MATLDIQLCRCARPLITTNRGEVYCHHCDRECTKDPATCIDCRLLDKATKEHALRTAPQF